MWLVVVVGRAWLAVVVGRAWLAVVVGRAGIGSTPGVLMGSRLQGSSLFCLLVISLSSLVPDWGNARPPEAETHNPELGFMVCSAVSSCTVLPAFPSICSPTAHNER